MSWAIVIFFLYVLRHSEGFFFFKKMVLCHFGDALKNIILKDEEYFFLSPDSLWRPFFPKNFQILIHKEDFFSQKLNALAYVKKTF